MSKGSDDTGGKGHDDPSDHDSHDDHGNDDPTTHDAGDDHGADDPATHDVGDDHGVDASLQLVFNDRSGQWIFTDDTAEHTQWLDDHGHDGGTVDLRGPQAGEHAVSVWRFHDSASDVYFWTADAALKDQLLQTQPQLQFDGVAFQAFADDHGGSRQAIGVVWDQGAGACGSFSYLPADDAAQLAGVSGSDDLVYLGVAFYL